MLYFTRLKQGRPSERMNGARPVLSSSVKFSQDVFLIRVECKKPYGQGGRGVVFPQLQKAMYPRTDRPQHFEQRAELIAEGTYIFLYPHEK